MAAVGAITPAAGGRDGAAPHLDDGVVSEFLHRLPTRDAYRLTAVCPRWRALISSPAFLSRHLSPRPLPLLDGLPDAIVLQPKKLGYTHLMLVATDPAVHVALNLPRLPKYTVWDRYRPPRTKLPPPSTPVMELGDHAAAFFERTVPMLDFTIEASHGRLLLGRGRTRYFVCDPAANHWLALPPPAAIPPTRETACGFCYDVDAETGRVSFTIVLLARARFRRVLVETFSSATGSWTTTMLDAQGVARCLGTASPGIRPAPRPRRPLRRRARPRDAVVREPPDTEGSVERMARSLGSTGGRLRLCGFDVRGDNPYSVLPHDGLEGVHGVWVMDAEVWRRVHEAVVENIQAWYFKTMLGIEKSLDFAGAPGGYIVLDKDNFLLRYNLESGEKVELVRFYRDDGCIGALYRRSHAFPFYRSG
ncbi:hypothetical protein C2845_PM03G02560 [Panicum miliaceum]|uniref:F-box domain-containing protein n=1 Tax=Panicum miliaceum TaxID=4540 RepID=A0A3L6T855_PANMI|nr:hypothetical protein C2845_PM03G02560 [Panicum miliaceum]